ncbi:hypothetical protein EN952_32845, partial [Mesorhizobium sp. M7A.F.Ca.CA.001.15.1.1]
MTNTVTPYLLPRVDHQNGARRTSSRGGRCFPANRILPQRFRSFSNSERVFVKADLLPGDDESARPSPPPEGWPQKRRPPHLLPRRALFPRGKTNFAPEVSPLLKMAKGISSKPTSSPAMTNMAGLHLLPKVDPKNDTRRTSSPGGCCCFQEALPSA